MIRAALAIIMMLAVQVSAHQPVSGRSEEELPARALIQAQVDPKLVHLPIVDADDLRFIHLSTAQGLSQTRVQQIVQDDSGFIWFGTQYGLSRYDGYKFKRFAHDPSQTNSLGGMYIRSLFKDRSGDLWIGSEETLDRFDPRTETFTHYLLKSQNTNTASIFVYQISQDNEGYIWLATGTGLFKLDPTTGKTTQFQHDPKDPLSLSSNDIKSTLEDRSHRFWVAGGNGLDQFDPRTGEVGLHVPVRGPIRQFVLHEDSAGLLWLTYASGNGAGLSTYNPTSNVLSNFTFVGDDDQSRAFTGIYAVTEDQEGTLWLGTGGMGVLKLDRARQKFIRYRYASDSPDSISEDHVTTLMADDDGKIWVGLNSTGPNFFSTRLPFFRHLLYGFQGNSGGETLVNSIFQDHSGVIWLGSANGLNRLDAKTGRSLFFRTSERGVSASVIATAEDSAGNLWLGTVGQGLKRLNPRTGKIKTYLHETSNPNSLSNDVVAHLLFDGHDKLWVSTWDGLDLFDINTASFKVYKFDPNRQMERYNRFVKDEDGLLWLGTNSGLVRFDPRDAKFTHIDAPAANSKIHVNSAFSDSDGKIWLATQNGLGGLNADSTISLYPQPEGAGGNSISCILEDEFGYLWMSTIRGISRFDRTSRQFSNFSTLDGVGDLSGWDACFRTSSGEMYFGGFSGLIAFYPREIVDLPLHAPIRLTELKVGGKAAAIGQNSLLKQSIVLTNELTLTSEQKSISLEFAALNYLQSGATRYRYRMDGLEDRWNEVDSDQRVATYNNLPSGVYRFHAQATVGSSEWSEPGVILGIHVLPPWWQSWWFVTIIGLLTALLAWCAYQYRLRDIARGFEIRLEERVTERTRIARELHDTLLQGTQGMILLFQSIAGRLHKTDPTRAEMERGLDYADHLLKEARDRVQELRGGAPDDNADDTIARMGREIVEGSSAKFNATTTGMRRALSPTVIDDLYRIAREGLSNAVRHAQAGRIEAQMMYETDRFVLRIRDDGVGVDPEMRPRPGHFGVPGMQERATKIGATFSIARCQEGGTEVEVAVPAAHAYSHG